MAPIIPTEITAITGTDGQALIRLMTWLSPSFPVGGFAYSAGLERAVHDRLVGEADDLGDWIGTMLRQGSWWNDAVLLAAAWRAEQDGQALGEILALAEALAGSSERHLEIINQGEAFVAAAAPWPHPVLVRLGDRPPYCVAVGSLAAAHGIGLEPTLAAYLHALCSQAVSAAIRLNLLGQRQGVATLATLESIILETSTKAAGSTLDDLGSATVMADLAALRHETQYSRIFRS